MPDAPARRAILRLILRNHDRDTAALGADMPAVDPALLEVLLPAHASLNLSGLCRAHEACVRTCVLPTAPAEEAHDMTPHVRRVHSIGNHARCSQAVLAELRVSFVPRRQGLCLLGAGQAAREAAERAGGAHGALQRQRPVRVVCGGGLRAPQRLHRDPVSPLLGLFSLSGCTCILAPGMFRAGHAGAV